MLKEKKKKLEKKKKVGAKVNIMIKQTRIKILYISKKINLNSKWRKYYNKSNISNKRKQTAQLCSNSSNLAYTGFKPVID